MFVSSLIRGYPTGASPKLISTSYGGYKVVDVPMKPSISSMRRKLELAYREHLKVIMRTGVGENEVFYNEFVQFRDQFDESHTGLARRWRIRTI